MDAVLIQAASSADKARNLEAAASWIRTGASMGGRLVVLPEMFMGLPGDARPPQVFAEPLDGPFVRALGAVAKECGVWAVCGVWERSVEPARPFNTAVVVGPDGALAAAYRKVHLFDALGVRESERMMPGRERPPVWDIDGVRVGLAICYDLRFGRLFEDLALRGAAAAVIPAAWYAGPMKEEHWLTLLRARAIENTFYVLGANQVGGAFCGRSAAFDPFGVTLAEAGEREGAVRVRVDPQRVREVRDKLPALNHRRPDVYG